MSEPAILRNRLRECRTRRGWSQEELAARAGVSRAGVSAIEVNRLVPSTAAALSLARALDCRVEDLFGLADVPDAESGWAWTPEREPARYWQAEVRGRLLRYPVEATGLGFPGHDGVWREGAFLDHGVADPRATLVLACCDPAAGLLVSELARSKGIRLLVLMRSSRNAIALLKANRVHLAGVHLARADAHAGNAALLKSELGAGYTCLRLARWQEGVVLGPGTGVRSLREALRRELRWVGREPGSGARQCLDELLQGRRPPRRLARDHRGVAEAVRCGWADAGVCLRLVAEEARLPFLGVREEAYDLCFPAALSDDARVRALLDTVRSRFYREMMGELPGYDTAATGVLEQVV